MLNQPTMEKLQTMKLHGMAQAFREQYESADASQLSFEERFGLLVDCQWTWKENRALTRRLRCGQVQRAWLDRGHRLPASPRLGPPTGSCALWLPAIGSGSIRTC